WESMMVMRPPSVQLPDTVARSNVDRSMMIWGTLGPPPMPPPPRNELSRTCTYPPQKNPPPASTNRDRSMSMRADMPPKTDPTDRNTMSPKEAWMTSNSSPMT